MYPGQIFSTSALNPAYVGAGVSQTTQHMCSCGSPATKVFSNPRGISQPIEGGWYLSPTLYLCDACDFRHTVMRAAGRSEEFITEYEEKQEARQRAEAEQQRKLNEEYAKHYNEAKYSQLQAYQDWLNTGQQNYNGLNIQSPETCTENVQLPEESKPWYKKLLQLGGK